MSRSNICCLICGFERDENRFYRFPQEECRRLQWATAVGIPVNEIPRSGKLCQKHFLDDDFHTPNFITDNMKIRLRQTAVPSRFLESMNRRRRKLPLNLKNHFQPYPPVLAENNHVSESPDRSDPIQKKNCVICGPNKGQHVSYHLFPNSDERKKDWLLACNIDKENYQPTMRVCSIHFQTQEVRNNSKRHRLIAGSVPSLCLPNEDLMSFENTPTTNQNGDFYNSVAAQVEDLSNRTENLMSFENTPTTNHNGDFYNSVAAQVEDLSNRNENFMSFENTHTTNHNGDFYNSVAAQVEDLSNRSVNVQSSTEQNSTFTPKSTDGSTPKFNKNRPIRYPGDISTPHFSTPTSARYSVNLLKGIIEKLKRDKRTLQQKLRRAKETIQNLNGVIAEMKNTNLISEGLNAQLYKKSIL